MAQYYIPLVGTPQIGNGGGSDLPAVTSEDNGDVLTVVNGAWDKAAPSGGGGALVVPTYTTEDNETYTCDMTFAEVMAAVEAGTCRHAIIDASVGYLSIVPLMGYAPGENGELNFGVTYVNDAVYYQTLRHTKNAVSVAGYQYPAG